MVHALQSRQWSPGGPGWTWWTGRHTEVVKMSSMCLIVGQHQSVCIQAGGWTLAVVLSSARVALENLTATCP